MPETGGLAIWARWAGIAGDRAAFLDVSAHAGSANGAGVRPAAGAAPLTGAGRAFPPPPPVRPNWSDYRGRAVRRVP
jgi:hypothetical protein